MNNPLRQLGPAALLLLTVSACQPRQTFETPYQGTLEHEQGILSFELPGRVLHVTAERGDVLKRYQTIARLDDTLERIQKSQLEAQARASAAELDLLYEGTRKETIQEARARLTAAQTDQAFQVAELQRKEDLYTADATTDEELRSQRTQAALAQAKVAEAREALAALRSGPRAQEIQAGEARLEAARIAINASEERIRRHVLVAPGPGEVLDTPVKRGEFVAPGTPALVLADTTRPYVDVFVPQAEIGRFAVGKAVQARVDTYAEPFTGRVQYLSPVLEFTPRYLFSPQERPDLVVRVRVRLHDPTRRLKAGIPVFVDPDVALSEKDSPPSLRDLVPVTSDVPLNPPQETREPSSPANSAGGVESGPGTVGR